MFVQNLNAKQQAALLYMAKAVAHADGNMDELQLGMMEILAKQAEAGVKEMVVPLDELPILFDTERSRCSLLLELLGIAHVNNEYHVHEKDLIGQYANILQISPEKLIALEAWVEKQIALSQEIETILG